jgi:hypothetical protein
MAITLAAAAGAFRWVQILWYSLPLWSTGDEIVVARSLIGALISIALLIAACVKAQPESAGVAGQFIQAYFKDDDVAAAAKLTSGAVKTRLDATSQQIKAADDMEPTKDRPKVKITLLETHELSATETRYVYRIESEVAGIQPILANLRLKKDGGAWTVDDFVQAP